MDGNALLLPSGWQSYFDAKSQRHYFVNSNVSPPQTTWDDPRTEAIEKAPGKPVAAAPGAVAPAPSAAPQAAAAASPPPAHGPPGYTPYSPPVAAGAAAGSSAPMPAGWVAVLDAPSGRFFFVDTTKSPVLRTWDDPRTEDVETAPNTPVPKAPAPSEPKSMADLLRPVEPLVIVSMPYSRPPYADETYAPAPPSGKPPAGDPLTAQLQGLSQSWAVAGGGRSSQPRYSAPGDPYFVPPPQPTPGATQAGIAAGALMVGGMVPAIPGILGV
ncbi:hypothetical protein DFJ74DRAFT_706361 [Hyaloraphidium curvatum]|nr:hypothetical protein DFJ74DRAFT_706361 [Hyaloraphidium curvatum]